MLLRALSLVVVVYAILCSAALAQNITGTILGNVTDPSGSAVPNAEIEITQSETNQSTRVKTDEAGFYQAPYLRPGNYRVSAGSGGFKRSVRDGLLLRLEDRLRIDFRLELGDTSATVQVTAEAPLIESENASLGQVVSSRSVQELPIQGRNIFDLVGLSAGVQLNPRAIGGTASTGTVGTPLFVLSDISINGGRFRTNEYLVDGISIMLPENNNFAISPTPDGTQEFKVLTNSFGPQFGRSGGGVINVVTRSGSNDLHGAGFWFTRNEQMRANNWFGNARNQPRAPFAFDIFGGAIGGPVVKDRTFFFADYQGHRESAQGGAAVVTVPTAQQRRGDFSGLLNAQGQPVIIYDPFSTRAAPGGGFVRDPFPGNMILESQQSRAARRLLEFMPLPNRPGEGPAQINNYAWSPSSFVNSDQWSARLDHRLSERQSLFGRVSRNTGDTGVTGPYGNIADTVLGTTLNRVITGVVNWTATLSATRILNVRGGATRRFEGRIPRSSGQVDLTDLGFPSYVAAAVQEQIFPSIGIASYSGLGGGGRSHPSRE